MCGHHGHAHHHGHGGCSGGHGAGGDFGKAFALAVALNVGFVALELGFGFWSNSTALIADAGHNLSDVLGLLLAWAAQALSKASPGGKYTYGLRSSSILAAVANACLLLVACGAIAWEAAGRFMHPPEVAGLPVMAVAGMGIAVNGISAWLFVKGSKGDLNVRGAYLHMLADAAVSFGVVLAGASIAATGWYWLDPAVSLGIVAAVVWGTWSLLRESVGLALHAAPSGIDLEKIQSDLLALPGVEAVHDLHVWGMSTTESALTVHLVMPAGYPGDEFMDGVERSLRERHGISHCVLQMEQGTTEHVCGLRRAA